VPLELDVQTSETASSGLTRARPAKRRRTTVGQQEHELCVLDAVTDAISTGDQLGNDHQESEVYSKSHAPHHDRRQTLAGLRLTAQLLPALGNVSTSVLRQGLPGISWGAPQTMDPGAGNRFPV
jgi:hypothetical protein